MPENNFSLRTDLQAIADLVPAKSRVLDIGCSNGDLLAWLRNEKQIDGRGIEISQSDVSTCVQRGLTVIQGDADHDLQHYPNQSYDYVIASHLLQATQHPKEVLQEMLRIGRHAILSIPNFGYWRNRLQLTILGRMPVTRTLHYQWYDTPNIHFCTSADFKNLAENLGCFCLKTSHLNSAGKPISKIANYFPNLMAEKSIFVLTR
jgi:methionine biosynthesis protein MetW